MARRSAIKGNSKVLDESLIKSIGKLGFGFMRMPSADGLRIDHDLLKKLVDRFIEAGFMYFDTAYMYTGSEEALCDALVKRHKRDRFTVTTKMPVLLVDEPGDMQKTFDTSMEKLGLDHLDFYLMHGISLELCYKLEDFGAWEFGEKLKAQGRIRHFGFSFHDTPEHLDEILTRHPDTELVQLQINYLDWDNPDVQSRRLHETVRKHGVPFTIMGPVKGGLLSGAGSMAEKELRKVAPGRSAASWAVRFAASLDGLLAMLSGMGTMEQLEDNIDTIKNLEPLSEYERNTLHELAAGLRQMPTVQCTKCKYCVEHCPMELQIPDLIELYNEYMVYNQTKSIGYQFEFVTTGGRFPSKCTACRTCEKHCPQRITISDIMSETAAVYES